MSTYQQLADRLLYRLGARDKDLGPSSSTTSRVYDFLEDGETELAHRLKNLGIRLVKLEDRIDFAWPANTDDQGYDTIVTSGRLYAVLKAFDLTNKVPLQLMEPPAFEVARLQVPTGPPTHWSSFERTLSIVPKPTVATTIRFLVYLDPALVTSISASPAVERSYEPGMLLLSEVAAWEDIEDRDKAQAAEARFERWLERKRAPAEHERSQRHSRGFRPHPAMITNRKLGI